MNSKIITSILLIIAAISIASAQQPYVRMYGGYGFGYGADLIAEYNLTSEETNGLYGSFGKGASIGGAIGLSIYRNISFEFGVLYCAGSTYEYDILSPALTSSNKYDGYNVSIVPSIILKSGSANIEPFLRMGLLISFPNLKLVSDQIPGGRWSGEYSGRAPIGWCGGIGTFIRLNNFLIISGELLFTSVTWGPEELKLTSPSGITTTYRYKESYDDSQINTYLIKKYSYSSLGITVGLVYSF